MPIFNVREGNACSLVNGWRFPFLLTRAEGEVMSEFKLYADMTNEERVAEGMRPVKSRDPNRIKAIMVLELQGVNQEEIAKTVGMSRKMAWHVRKSPLYQQEITKLRKQMMDRATKEVMESKEAEVIIQRSAPLAACKMVSLINAESEGVQLKASADILDRAGFARKVSEMAPSVEIEEKFIERIERVMGDGEGTVIRERTVTHKKEVSE